MYICVSIMLLLAIISLVIYRDLLCPLFLFYIPWIASIGLLSFSQYDYNPNSGTYVYLTLGGLVFFIGFLLSNNGMEVSKRYEKSDETYRIRPMSIKVLISFETLLALYCLFDFYRIYRKFNVGNIYISIMRPIKLGQASLSSLTVYGLSIISLVTICMLLVWFYLDKREKSSIRGWMCIQLVIGGFSFVSSMTRTGILFNLLAVFVVLIICLNVTNGKLFWFASLFVIGFLVFFSYFTILKFPESGLEKTELILSNLSVYTSGGIVAFEKFFGSNQELLWGQHTFRIFYVFGNRIFGTPEVVSLIKEFIDIGNNLTTNVYTMYAFYIADFGKVFGLVMQFLVAIGYGVVYKNMVKKRAVSIFIFAISIYPLIMQFFAEQYFSMLSKWVQCVLIAAVFFETDIFLVKNNKELVEGLNNAKK